VSKSTLKWDCSRVYTEGVGQFQPRVELWQPWEHECSFASGATLKGDALRYSNRKQSAITLSGFWDNQSIVYIPGFPKLNPGLKLANTFGVNLGSKLTSNPWKRKQTSKFWLSSKPNHNQNVF